MTRMHSVVRGTGTPKDRDTLGEIWVLLQQNKKRRRPGAICHDLKL